MRSLRFSCKCSDFSCLAETGAGAGPITAQMWRCLCSCHGDGAISLVEDAVLSSHWRRDAVRAIFCFNGHISWKISPNYPSWLDISDILLPFKSEMWLESDSRLNNCRASSLKSREIKRFAGFKYLVVAILISWRWLELLLSLQRKREDRSLFEEKRERF